MARIFSFESLATLDGEGVRYAVFFEGCPLRCAYCHNPESWYCHNSKDYTIDEVFNKIKRYKPYFKNKGGVTFSGGEPLLNAKFINEINELLKKENISYVLDTSGMVNLTDEVKCAIDNSQMVILDLKFNSEENYLKYAKGSLSKVLEFLDYLKSINKRTWIRTVIIPNINNDYASLDKYLEILKDYKFIEKYELLGFHTMGFTKYENLNIENPLKNTLDLDKNELQLFKKYVEAKFKNE